MLVPWLVGCADPPSHLADPAAAASERGAPPPVSGGGLARVGDRIVVADVDGGRLLEVDPARREVTRALPLGPSLPGRVAADDQGRGYVALRGTGEVAAFDVAPLALRWRVPVCAAPTGLAWDAERGVLRVACASGRLVALDASGEVVHQASVVPDLRDVVVEGGRIWASTFRSATILRLSPEGEVLDRHPIRDLALDGAPGPSRAAVGWALVAAPQGGVALLHQWRSLQELVVDGDGTLPTTTPTGGTTTEGGGSAYGGGGCGTVVLAGVSGVGPDGEPFGLGAVTDAVLAVDLAPVPEGFLLAVAGSPVGLQLLAAEAAAARTCGPASTGLLGSPGPEHTVAVLADDGAVWALGRQPLDLRVDDETVALPDADEADPDPAFDLFHRATPGAIACASCHPEAGDDGQVWTFADLGDRRTQPLRVHLAATAPYHWDGAFDGLSELMDDVLVGRMGGERVTDADVARLVGWLDALPVPRAAEAPDPDLVDRGRAVFSAAGCGGCHRGDAWTDDRSHDVGTGGAFQTPSLLGVSARPPWMHDGCAATLRERFDEACGGASHGDLRGLDGADLEALVALLEVL